MTVTSLLDRFFTRQKPTYNRAMPEGYLTTKQAAEQLGRSEQAIRDLIKHGRLKAEKFGSVWVISEEEIARFEPAKIGRPRKEA